MSDDRLDRLAVLARRAGHADLADLIEQSAVPEVEEHWSDWFAWAGGECPVPPETVVEVYLDHQEQPGDKPCAAKMLVWGHDNVGDITRFRYRSDNPCLWLPRPAGWVPLGAKFRFQVRAKGSVETKFFDGEMPEWWWAQVTHIRLLPRPAPTTSLHEAYRAAGCKCGEAVLPEWLAKGCRQALRMMLRHSGVADMDPEDKDGGDRAAERHAQSARKCAKI